MRPSDVPSAYPQRFCLIPLGIPLAVDVWAFNSLYDPNFFKFIVPVLWGHEKCSSGVFFPFEGHMDP